MIYCGCSWWLMLLDGVIIMTFLNQFLKILHNCGRCVHGGGNDVATVAPKK
jgi:hypothetical protein